jgi:hypothetical protein
MKKQILFAGILIVFASCFTKKAVVKTAIAEPEKKAVVVAEVKKEMPVATNTNLNVIAQGRALYKTKCNQCHDLKNEKSESERGWHHHVPEMVEMSNKAGKPITQAEQDLILGYLLAVIKE